MTNLQNNIVSESAIERTAEIIHAQNAFERIRKRKNPYRTPEAAIVGMAYVSRLPSKYLAAAQSSLKGRADGFNVTTLAAALAYADAGLSVVDAHALDIQGKGTGPGGQVKVPRGAKWQLRATTDAAAITSFWSGDGQYPATKGGDAYPFARIGAQRNVSITFPVGCGLFVLDIDGQAGKDALRALEQVNGTLPRHMGEHHRQRRLSHDLSRVSGPSKHCQRNRAGCRYPRR